MQRVVAREKIAETERLIRPHIRRTPVVETAGEDFGVKGVALVFKLELLQHSGSYKARGAFANMLLRDVPKAGVAAASGGNHGAAVAYAANRLGVAAKIFVPEISSPAKIARIRSLGADLVIGGAVYADALRACEKHLETSGAMSLHAFDAPETMLGAGTMALELEQQSPGLDAILIAVGGGGLIGGSAAWHEDRTQLVGVEPENAPTLHEALKAGRPVDVKVSGVAADSLGASRIGAHNFPIIKDRVAASVLVADEAIVAAQKALWGRLRIAAEPGGAAALAALMSGAWKPEKGARVGVVICGGNTSAVRFNQ
ncbi:MAG: threonine/serine dehydratase [Pseudomonadota bacterium]|nr:threonine/serine dehydratase [Pseudomonadota bacterium]